MERSVDIGNAHDTARIKCVSDQYRLSVGHLDFIITLIHAHLEILHPVQGTTSGSAADSIVSNR